MNNQKKRAFTLVELLVVIAILAILATVSIIGYSSFIGRARKSNAQTEAAQAKEVIIAEVVSNDKGKASIDEDLYFAYSKGKLVVAVEEGHTVGEDRNITDSMKGNLDKNIEAAFPELEGLEGEFWYFKDEKNVRYVKEYEIGENYKVNVLDTNDVIGPKDEGTTPGGGEGEGEGEKITVTFEIYSYQGSGRPPQTYYYGYFGDDENDHAAKTVQLEKGTQIYYEVGNRTRDWTYKYTVKDTNGNPIIIFTSEYSYLEINNCSSDRNHPTTVNGELTLTLQ